MPIIDNNNTSKESEGYKIAAKYFKEQVGYSYIPNGIEAQLLVPEIGTGALNLMGAIMNQNSLVSPELKMLIAYMTSFAKGCTYCQTATYSSARDGYSDSDKFAKIWEYPSSDLFSDGERAVLDLTLAASASPSDVTDEMRDNLKKHYNQIECAEIISMISLFAYFNAWNDTNGTRIDNDIIETVENELLGSGHIDEEKFKKLQSI
ncbi:MAG: alkylhydroperoxidase family enzyme [Gammaproteobacteria bacterium]|jgi:alkylhydroperoxidase family enzyme